MIDEVQSNSSMNVGSLLKQWVVPIVAILALIQPWIVALYKKFFLRGKIHIYETDTIEVGFSGLGPTIGLYGTLRAIQRDQFIRSINLAVVRQRDSSTHQFEWGLFRSGKASVSSPDDISFELPSGFMLMTKAPHRYNILFTEKQVRDDIQTHAQDVKKAWSDRVHEMIGKQLIEMREESAPLAAEINKVLGTLFENFSKDKTFSEAFIAIDHLFYWEPGTYTLNMNVTTARPYRSYSRSWPFELSKQDSERIRSNVIMILFAACDRDIGVFNFAYLPYKNWPSIKP